ncbi:hypothetical protein BGZ61DRAFT_486562 [Ilyonectria robusta]|uniref:uncharacterized protein n=1 Tax=Ilyonectria robusta TaxID=1079257 RepID=UPI001E8CB226|nr:uncharacterized protein BGZ61DRAFT_486562 [Ilyonectria robusta]KAH8656442.1 hypothetical protein BGZ61DRAFT_486562 [Ilyonectria robusta]
MALHVLPVTEARRGLVVDGELCDVAERGLESNQPLFNRREAIELFRVPMLASDVHVVDRADLRKLSIFQAGAALVAHLNSIPVVQWKALPALLKSPRGLQQGGRQLPLPLDGASTWRASGTSLRHDLVADASSLSRKQDSWYCRIDLRDSRWSWTVSRIGRGLVGARFGCVFGGVGSVSSIDRRVFFGERFGFGAWFGCVFGGVGSVSSIDRRLLFGERCRCVGDGAGSASCSLWRFDEGRVCGGRYNLLGVVGRSICSVFPAL